VTGGPEVVDGVVVLDGEPDCVHPASASPATTAMATLSLDR